MNLFNPIPPLVPYTFVVSIVCSLAYTSVLFHAIALPIRVLPTLRTVHSTANTMFYY